MKLSYLATILALSLNGCSSSKQTVTETKPASTPIFVSNSLTPFIDGKANDWPADFFTYNNSTKLLYAVAHDNNSLYIILRQGDRNQQMKMVNAGTEIWIDTKEKKNKSLGVAFPLGGEPMAPPAGNGEPNKNTMRLQLKLKMQSRMLTGFKEAFNGMQSAVSDSIVKTVIDWDDKDDMIYELAIPFSSLPGDMVAGIQNISVGIIIKALKMPEGFGGGAPGGARPGGGMPQGGMRPPGGGSMPDRSQMESMMKENSFWTRYTITKK